MTSWVEHVRVAVHGHRLRWSPVPALISNLVTSHRRVHDSILLGMEVLPWVSHQVILSHCWHSACWVLDTSCIAIHVKFGYVVLTSREFTEIATRRRIPLHWKEFFLSQVRIGLFSCHHLSKLVRFRLRLFFQWSWSHACVLSDWWQVWTPLLAFWNIGLVTSWTHRRDMLSCLMIELLLLICWFSRLLFEG